MTNIQNPKGIYCLGSALVDYEFEVTQEQLETLGLVKGQMTLADTNTFDQAFTSLNQNLQYHREGGGSAMNSLITYSRLGGHGGTHCIVGKDNSGEFFLQELRDLNIDITVAEHSSAASTGRCLALISPDKDRTMMTNLGINEELQLDDSTILTKLQGFKVLYAESYMFASEKPRATLLAYLKEARQNDILISLSLSDVSMVTYCREHIETALDGRVDILFGNYEEYKNYTGKEELDDIFAFFPENIRCLVLTRGEQGATILRRGNNTTEVDDDELISSPSPATQVVDTLGAGDTYAGAFLYAIFERDLSYTAAAKFAAQAAGKVISRLGPRLSSTECEHLLNLS